jgi:phosphoglycolate phosphatase
MFDRVADVIFDLDGTLIDSAPSILACFTAVLAEHRIEPVRPLTEALIGPPLRETLRQLSGVEDGRRLEAMIEAFKRHYDGGGYKASRVFPGVDNMLRELSTSGLSLHIATNKRSNPTRLILEYLGWAELFSRVYTSDYRTPPFSSKSEMLSVLVDSEGLSPERAVYVGDRSDDKKAAVDNGLIFIAATWGYRDSGMAEVNEGIISANEAAEIPPLLVRNSRYDQTSSA